MNQVRKLTRPIISEVEKILNRSLDNVYLNTALKVFLVLYAALAAPKFPSKLAFLMDNIFVRIGVSFLIVFMALRDPGLALMIAVAFVITLQTASKMRLIDTNLSQALPGETSWLPSAKEGFTTETPSDTDETDGDKFTNGSGADETDGDEFTNGSGAGQSSCPDESCAALTDRAAAACAAHV